MSHTQQPRPDTTQIRDLVDTLHAIPDPRHARGIRFHAGTILAVMLFTVLAGARTFREIGDRAADLPQELLELAGCPTHRHTHHYLAPSEPTMRRMAHAIDADDADRRLCSWIHQLTLAQQAARDVGNVDAQENLVPLAIDGKVIRDTIAPGRREGSEIKLFSALLHSEAIVIAQRAIPSVTNEITQVQELLAGTDLTGMVVTADAAHAQHATARYLTSTRDSDYVLTVKGNQPGLLEQVHAVPPPPVPGSEHFVDDDFSKGRIVRRAIWAASATSVVFPGVEQVFRIRRDTFDHRGNWLTKEFVHGVTSLTAARCSARQIAEHVRGHWGIENRIHWVRDVVFSEDGQHAYSGSGAHCLAIFRNMAVGLLRLSGRVEIKRAVEWVAADRARIFQVMAGVAHV